MIKGKDMLTNEQESAVFKALADDTRRQIARSLAAAPQPVHRLAKAFALTRPAISRHLRVMRDAGLVDSSEDGRQNVYFLKTSTLREVEEWLSGIWSARLSSLKALVEEEEYGRK